VVASEKYLGWTMPCGEANSGVDWRVQVRRATKEWGNWLVRLLGAKRALGIGGTLTLLSLGLVVEGGPLSPDYKGYQIVAGSGVWPTIDRRWPEQLEVLLAQGAPTGLRARACRCRPRARRCYTWARGEEAANSLPFLSHCSASAFAMRSCVPRRIRDVAPDRERAAPCEGTNPALLSSSVLMFSPSRRNPPQSDGAKCIEHSDQPMQNRCEVGKSVIALRLGIGL